MSDGTDPARVRREWTGKAIRRYRGDRSQADLAAALGVSQAGVSLWESGGVDFTYEQILAIEALGLPLGTLGRAAGYVVSSPNSVSFSVPVDDVNDVAEVVRAASRLGLHVAVANRFDAPTDGGSEAWIAVIGSDDASTAP